MLPSSISSSGGVGVGFGLRTGGGGGSPNCGAMRSTGPAGRCAGVGVGVGVDVGRLTGDWGVRGGVCTARGVGVGVGCCVIAVLRLGRFWLRAANPRLDPNRKTPTTTAMRVVKLRCFTLPSGPLLRPIF
jgi:hypothetical protein